MDSVKEYWEARAKRAEAAILALLSDYRSEGCPDPRCGVCRRSKAAEANAREVLKEAEKERFVPKIDWSKVEWASSTPPILGIDLSRGEDKTVIMVASRLPDGSFLMREATNEEKIKYLMSVLEG